MIEQLEQNYKSDHKSWYVNSAAVFGFLIY